MLKEEMKIGPKGQVVIPKAFRKSLGLHPGNKVDISVLTSLWAFSSSAKVTSDLEQRHVINNQERSLHLKSFNQQKKGWHM